MLGMSLGKFLVLVLVILVVWNLFKWFGRRGAQATRARTERPDARSVGEDLIACPACGTYATRGLTTCPSGRDDCPLRAR